MTALSFRSQLRKMTAGALMALLLIPAFSFITIQTAQAATIFTDGFESGSFSVWTSVDSTASGHKWRVDNTGNTGTNSAQVNGSTGQDSDILQKTISTSGYQDVMLSYNYKGDSLEAGDKVEAQWTSNGTTWQTLFTITDGNDDGAWHLKSHSVSSTASFAFRFVATLDQGNDSIRIDDVSLVGTAVPTTATLVVIKQVINDDGGTKLASDFALHVTNSSSTPANFAGNASGTVVTVTPGSYSVSEDAVAGYSSSLGANCSGTIAAGEAKTCIVTNNDIEPKLTVTKSVVNDNGGMATVGSFALFVGNTSVTSGQQAGFNAGTYMLSEQGPGGYDTSFGDDCASDGSITLAPGDVKNCTITNDDKQAKLTVTKIVDNEDGGEAAVGDFPLFVNGTPVTSGQTLMLNAGQYSVSETNNQARYVGVFSGSCDVNGLVTLGVGEEKTCTITNTFTPPAPATLKVIKQVTNDHGGTMIPSDFTINVEGTSVSDNSFPGADGEGVTVTMAAGSYSVSENSVFGYTASFSSGCSGTLAEGASATCIVTNDDIQPKLIVIKNVINDDGGIKQASEFTLYVNARDASPESFSGVNTPGVEVTLDAGEYSVGEREIEIEGDNEYEHPEYLREYSDDCSGTIGIGETKTCTVTNDDNDAFFPQRGTLVVIKSVVNDNGGTAVASDFTITVTGNNPSASSFGGSATGVVIQLDPGSYSVDEPNPGNYIKVIGNGCMGEIEDDQTIVCTIINDQDLVRGGGGGSQDVSGGTPPGGGGEVLGESTSTEPIAPPAGGNSSTTTSTAPVAPAAPEEPQGEVLGDTCEPLLTGFLFFGARNDSAQVLKLQRFLNGHMGSTLPINGTYGTQTRNAVNAFQLKYANEVLKPWQAFGLPADTPTGNVYKTTQWKINMLSCPSLNLPLPQLP